MTIYNETVDKFKKSAVTENLKMIFTRTSFQNLTLAQNLFEDFVLQGVLERRISGS